LEHHPDFAPDSGDVADVVSEFGAVDNDVTTLMLLQPVDRPDEGGLASTGRAKNDDHLAAVHVHRDAFQGMETAIPFVHVAAFDDWVV
jgi:hypothetical protein